MKFFFNLSLKNKLNSYHIVTFVASIVVLKKTANKQSQIFNSRKAFCYESSITESNRANISQINNSNFSGLQIQINYFANKIRDLTIEYKNLVDPDDDNSTYHEPVFVESFLKESQ